MYIKIYKDNDGVTVKNCEPCTQKDMQKAISCLISSAIEAGLDKELAFDAAAKGLRTQKW